MRFLFELTHPAHVHLFKNAIAELTDRGHAVCVTSREKEMTTDLLDAFGIEHEPLSSKRDGKLGLVAEWLRREVRLLRVALEFRPTAIACVANPVAASVSRLVGARCVVFNDGENTDVMARLSKPFADAICTPEKFSIDYGAKHRRYPGYHELAYLHPNRFEPDDGRLREYGVEPTEPYAVLRFIAWAAYHDVGQHGLSPTAKRRLVDRLDEEFRVYITSEAPLPSPLRKHGLPVPPDAIHHLLARANLYVGDSGTMATEAAVLGVPAFRVSTDLGSRSLSNFVELEEEYGLLYSTTDEGDVFEAIEPYLTDPSLREEHRRRRQRLLTDKIDVTDFIVDLLLDSEPSHDGW